jgi:hypothetical protein
MRETSQNFETVSGSISEAKRESRHGGICVRFWSAGHRRNGDAVSSAVVHCPSGAGNAALLSAARIGTLHYPRSEFFPSKALSNAVLSFWASRSIWKRMQLKLGVGGGAYGLLAKAFPNECNIPGIALHGPVFDSSPVAAMTAQDRKRERQI